MNVTDIKSLENFIGKETGVSDWVTIDQPTVNGFADITRDHQYIHVDPDKAKESPFGGTVAHGFLSLSYLSHFAEQATLQVEGAAMLVNYGFDKLRFLAPVPVGSRIRGQFVLKDVQERTQGQILLTYTVSVEIEGVDKPALLADWLMLIFIQEA